MLYSCGFVLTRLSLAQMPYVLEPLVGRQALDDVSLPVKDNTPLRLEGSGGYDGGSVVGGLSLSPLFALCATHIFSGLLWWQARAISDGELERLREDASSAPQLLSFAFSCAYSRRRDFCTTAEDYLEATRGRSATSRTFPRYLAFELRMAYGSLDRQGMPAVNYSQLRRVDSPWKKSCPSVPCWLSSSASWRL